MSLTNKQKVFVEEYLHDFNATQAAIRAGYSEKTAYSIGWENLRKPEILEIVEKRLQEKQMSADEALSMLADIARGDLGEFMDISSVGFNLDLLDENGDKKKTRLIKKIKQKTTTFIAKKESDEDREVTETEIELYPADNALRDILKIHGKFIDRQDITSGGKALTWREFLEQNDKPGASGE